MLEVGTKIRAGWLGAIKAIPGWVYDVFDEFTVAEDSSPYVVLSTQTEQQIGNDGPFLYDCTIMIKVVAFGSLVTGKKAAEDVGALILGLMPDYKTQPFVLADPLKLIDTKLVSTNTMPMDAKDKVYITKLYRFSQTVSQSN